MAVSTSSQVILRLQLHRLVKSRLKLGAVCLVKAVIWNLIDGLRRIGHDDALGEAEIEQTLEALEEAVKQDSVDAIRALVQRANAHGVKHLVLLSGRGEPDAQASERIVQESGMDWTIVRASWSNQNFS